MLTANRLREVLDYNPETGIFTWKISLSKIAKGQTAGSRASKTRYIRIKIDDRVYMAHRLAWLYVYGVWPSLDLDHIDRNGKNNSITNLREATPSQNHANSEVYKNNTLGVKGVVKRGNNYKSYIMIDRVQIALGTFKTVSEASQAYQQARKCYYGDFSPVARR